MVLLSKFIFQISLLDAVKKSLTGLKDDVALWLEHPTPNQWNWTPSAELLPSQSNQNKLVFIT